MKDFILSNLDGEVLASMRAEALSNTPANFEPVEIKDGTGAIVDHVVIAGTVWQKLPYSFKDLVGFATDNNLTLTVADTNGANKEELVAAVEPVGGE